VSGWLKREKRNGVEDEACLIEAHRQFLRDKAGNDGARMRRTGSDLRIMYSP
jgi:hypothetical protein